MQLKREPLRKEKGKKGEDQNKINSVLDVLF